LWKGDILLLRAWHGVLSRRHPRVMKSRMSPFYALCRRTISLIQIGAKGDVQPFDT
jgi:hypothetical protein